MYLQWENMIFDSLLKTKTSEALFIIINLNNLSAFTLFMNNHITVLTGFKNIIKFLHMKYFSRVAFRPIYLTGKKTFVFINKLKIIDFMSESEDLWPTVKH